MALEFNTCGFKLKYGVETTAGTKPAAFTEIENIVSLAALNSQPNPIQVTNLVDPKHRYIAGLVDNGGTYEVTVNGTAAVHTAWGTMVSASATGRASGFDTWFEIVYPTDSGITDAYFFTGIPTALGFFGAEVDTAYQGTAYITVNDDKGLSTAV